MSESVTIGIDLGTSNSCVAAMVDGEPTVLANCYGERTTASVVGFRENGVIEVGNRARANIILDPKTTVSSAKRLIGRYFFSEELKKARAICRYEIVSGENQRVCIKIRDEKFSLPEVSAFVLKEMKRIAEESLGCEVSKAVITVPAYFNDNQRQATKDAGRIAGLEVLRILNEPTAAALAYGYGRDLRQKVAVYDFGGGTFDVSVLEIGADVFEVLSTSGDTFLGGDDFDDRIIDLLADKVQAEQGVNVRTDPVAFQKLKEASEGAKIELSESESVRIDLPDLLQHEGRTIALEHEFSRVEFDKLVKDLIFRTFKVCDEAMQQAGLTVRDIEGLILVGGPTKLPSIRNAVREYFQREPEVDINPDEVVAIGAGIHAASLVSVEESTFLLDVTPLSLRLGISGDMTEPIIHRNSPVPIDHTRVFTTATDYQDTISVRIYQGEARAAEGNELLGEFEFSGFEPGVRGEVQIEVTFEISTEGIVQVSALDPQTGAEQSALVTMSSGLSPKEIEAIMTRGRAADVLRGNQPVDVAPSSQSSHALPPAEEQDDLILDMEEPDEPDASDDEEDTLFGRVGDDLGGAAEPAVEAQRPESERDLELDDSGGDLALEDDEDDDADEADVLLEDEA